MIKHKYSEVLNYFIDDSNSNEYMTHNGYDFYTRNKSKVYNEKLLSNLKQSYTEHNNVMVILETLEDFTVPINKFSYSIENGKVVELSFKLSDATFVNNFNENNLEQRLNQYKDVIGIRLNGTTYWCVWNEKHDEYNTYQRNFIHGDYVRIKFVGDE